MGFFSGISNAVKGISGAISSITNPISSIANAAGPFLSYFGQQQANAANVSLSKEQMEWQEKMRGTAYQAAVTDLKKAGLNPMLAYSHGPTATPGGSLAKVENEIEPMVNSARRSQEYQLMLDRLKSEIDANEADAYQKNATANNQMSQARYTDTLVAAGSATAAADLQTSQKSLNERLETKVRSEIDHIAEQLDLTKAQKELALRAIDNALETGHNIRADTGNKEADTALKKLSERLQSYSENYLRNASEAQKTLWMEKIAPFLPDLLQSGNTASKFLNR